MAELVSVIKNGRTIVRYESCKTRTNRYFMINPRGDVVIPSLRKGNVFYEKRIGSLIDDSNATLSNWEAEFDLRNYLDSVKIFNMEAE